MAMFEGAAFGDNHTKAGLVLGRLLTGYGELEFEMTLCVGAAVNDRDLTIRDMYQSRGEFARIRKAKTNLNRAAANQPLRELSARVLDDMDWCREIRNQYAHCQWWGSSTPLSFINMEEVAEVIGVTGPLEGYKRSLDMQVLTEQEQFFGYVRQCFWHLTGLFEIQAGKPATLSVSLPDPMPRPRKHL